MIAEYISKIIEVFKKKPETMAWVGFALMILFASINWTYPMYIAGAMALVGYLKRNKKKAK